jgi:hypothetical protein
MQEKGKSLMFIPKRSHDDHDEEEYYAIPNIPYEDGDFPQHNSNGFCDDMTHECHENQELINGLEQSRQDGEISDADANRIYRGKTLGGWW